MKELFTGVVPFVFTARERSFRGAATQLGVTPAAVSKAVQKLERELGVTLLHRTTRKVSLSREGEMFFARCERAIELVHGGRQALALVRDDPGGELTVTAPHIFGRALAVHLAKFHRRYPGLHVHLRFSDSFEELVDSGIDVAIRIGELADSSLVGRVILRPHRVTVASPSYLARAGRPDSPHDLNAHACIKFRSPRGRLVEWSFVDPQTGAPLRVSTSGPVDMDHGERLLDAARGGVGLTQAFDFMVTEALREGSLVEVLEPYAAAGPPVHAVCLPEQRRVPRVRAFLDFLAESFAPGRTPATATAMNPNPALDRHADE